jgi:signal transduction histidine kinase
VKYSGASRWIGLRLAAGQDEVIVEVEDRGVGIDEGEQKRIFDRFYRSAKGSGKGGYGLGLYMVDHISRAHGGRVVVRSTPGQGSTFRIAIPSVQPDADEVRS